MLSSIRLRRSALPWGILALLLCFQFVVPSFAQDSDGQLRRGRGKSARGGDRKVRAEVDSLEVGTPSSTVIVRPDNTRGWASSDTRPGGAVNFVTDATAPSGFGALQLTTDATDTAKADFFHGAAANTTLASINQLSYYTKQNSASFAQADPSYQIPVYLNGGTAGFSTLVYEPYQNTAQGTVQPGVWQQWDAAAGLFYSTRAVTCSNGTIPAGAGGPATLTLNDIKTACPSAVVIGYGVNIGSFNPSWDVETDLFNFNGTVYNFEPAVTTINVTSIGAGTPTPTDNDYTRINNAVQTIGNGGTITLAGTFNWTEPNAAASWALGSDGVAGTDDDYSIAPPADLNGVTFTAANLGAATIQGPGDLAAFNLEGVFYFGGGDNQNWTISKIRFVDFDIAIGMFNGAGGTDAYNGTHILNNYILVARDLNSTVAPADVNQNIGIHYSFGTNEVISGNTIELHGDGVSAAPNFSTEVGMQSNTSGSNVYDGLQITNNVIRVLNAQDNADPQNVLGIWENGHAHTSNITVSGNVFTNAAAGNDPAVNRQTGFRVTSHSSATTSILYQNNSVSGARTGIEWLVGQTFTGNQPVILNMNTIVGNGTGVRVQSQGAADLAFNRIVGNTVGVENVDGIVMAENNWWGCNFGPGQGGTGCAGTANPVVGSVDADPWLVLTSSANNPTIPTHSATLVNSTLTMNSAGQDTSGLGHVPDGIPAAFSATNGTVTPTSRTTSNGATSTIFLSGAAAGPASASTTIDQQTATAPITVTQGATPRNCASIAFPINVVTEFSLGSNPNCEFAYGYTADPNVDSAFSLYGLASADDPVSGIDRWYRDFPDPDFVPAVVRNRNAGTTTYFSVQHPPNELNLHPGENGERSVVRFTAPVTGDYTIAGQFEGIAGAGTTSDAAIVRRPGGVGSAPLFAAPVNGFGTIVPFNIPVTLQAGDVIDFSVGYGSNANYGSDSTGLAATISITPTAADVSVSGRVMQADERGITGARVAISGGSLTSPRTTTTDRTGHYTFSDLPAGGSYTVSVATRRFDFENPTVVVTLNDNVTGVNFIGTSNR